MKFTVTTPSDSKYLMMYIEDGSLFKTWAATGNSSVSGNIRTWTINMSFSGAGERKLVFRTGTTQTAKGSGATVSFTVLPDEFEINNNGVLIAYHGNATEVIIPGGKGITSIGRDAFRGNDKITKVSIPTGVTTIQARAFEYCSALKTVSIPNSMKTMGAYAFCKCVKLTSLNLKSTGLTAIAESTFRECKSMTSISLPDKVSKIGKRAFYNCINLKNMN